MATPDSIVALLSRLNKFEHFKDFNDIHNQGITPHILDSYYTRSMFYVIRHNTFRFYAYNLLCPIRYHAYYKTSTSG